MSTAERIQLGISYLLRAILLVAAVVAIVMQHWMMLFVAVLALFATFLPWILARNYRLRLPTEFELALIIFVYADLFLGDIRGYYTIYWWWDLVLHAGSGIAMGFIGFLMLYTLYVEGRLQMSPLLIALFSFAFGLTIGVIWEILEFTADRVLAMDTQQSINDTMWDLIVDAAGALFSAVVGYVHLLHCHCKGRKGLFDHLLGKFFERNPHLRKQ